jgi:hypothetical protein
MKYLKIYQNFLLENIQQAENYLIKNNLDSFYYEYLKDYVKEKGKTGLLYLLTLILYSKEYIDQEKELNKIKEYVDKITQSNIKVDANQIKPEYFYEYVDNQIKKIDANKFIDEYAPGKLKKEIKKNYLDQIQNIDFQNISKDALRGKMSIFEKPEDWVKYVVRLTKGEDDLSKVKNSDDVDVLYENNEWIIYVPKTYEAINFINYPEWCTIYEDKYNDYIEKGYYFIILHNKENKKLSYIIQIFPEKDDTAYDDLPKNAEGYFSLHPYNGKVIWLSWQPKYTYLGWDKENLNKGILKIFFDKFVRNYKIEL